LFYLTFIFNPIILFIFRQKNIYLNNKILFKHLISSKNLNGDWGLGIGDWGVGGGGQTPNPKPPNPTPQPPKYF